MRVSRKRMEENRTRILEAAGRLFRDKGFEAVTVVEVMKAAGLTHGGFYGYFASKDDLIAKTLAHSLRASVIDDFDLSIFLDNYLSPQHRDNPANGCFTAGLAAESRHQGPAARAAIADGIRRHMDGISAALPFGDEKERRRAAIGSWAAMVGAIILARSIDDTELSNEVLEKTHSWIEVTLGSGLRSRDYATDAAMQIAEKKISTH